MASNQYFFFIYPINLPKNRNLNLQVQNQNQNLLMKPVSTHLVLWKPVFNPVEAGRTIDKYVLTLRDIKNDAVTTFPDISTILALDVELFSIPCTRYVFIRNLRILGLFNVSGVSVIVDCVSGKVICKVTSTYQGFSTTPVIYNDREPGIACVDNRNCFIKNGNRSMPFLGLSARGYECGLDSWHPYKPFLLSCNSEVSIYGSRYFIDVKRRTSTACEMGSRWGYVQPFATFADPPFFTIADPPTILDIGPDGILRILEVGKTNRARMIGQLPSQYAGPCVGDRYSPFIVHGTNNNSFHSMDIRKIGQAVQCVKLPTPIRRWRSDGNGGCFINQIEYDTFAIGRTRWRSPTYIYKRGKLVNDFIKYTGSLADVNLSQSSAMDAAVLSEAIEFWGTLDWPATNICFVFGGLVLRIPIGLLFL